MVSYVIRASNKAGKVVVRELNNSNVKQLGDNLKELRQGRFIVDSLTVKTGRG